MSGNGKNIIQLEAEIVQLRQRLAELEQQEAGLLQDASASREHAGMSEALGQIAAALNSTLDLSVVLDRILEFVTQVVPCDAANIMLVDGSEVYVAQQLGYEAYGDAERIRALRQPIDAFPGMRQMWLRRRPLLIPNTEQDELWVAISPASDWIKSYAGAPIYSQDDLIGFLNVDSASPGRFRPEHAARLQAFADQAAIAIRNARQYEDARRRATEMEALRHITAALNSTLELSRVLDLILVHLERVVPYDSASIMLVTEGVARITRSRGFESEAVTRQLESIIFPIEETENLHLMVETRRPVVIRDTDSDPRWVALLEATRWIRSYIGAPVIVDEQIIGFLNLDSHTADHFTDADVGRLQAFVDQAAIAIRNARQYEETRQRAMEMEALRQMATALNGTLDFNEILDLILSQVARVVPCDGASVMLVEGRQARMTRSRGFEGPDVAGQVETLVLDIDTAAFLSDMIRTHQPIVVPDVQAEPTWVRMSGAADWIRGYLGAPIIVDEQIIGFLNLDSRDPARFTGADAERLQVFTQHVAIAIRNARQFEETRERARELEALRQMAAALNSTLDFNEVLDLILTQVAHVVHYDAANIMLSDGDQVYVAQQRGYAPLGLEEAVSGLRVPISALSGVRAMQATGQPHIIPDTDHSEIWESVVPASAWIKSYAGAPIRSGDELIGFLNLDSATPGRFSDRDSDRLRAFADQAAIAIRNAHQFKEIRQRAEELEALRQTAAALNSTLDFNEILDLILTQVARVVPYDSATIMLVDSGTAYIARCRGFSERGMEAEVLALRLQVDEILNLRMMRDTGAPFIIADTRQFAAWRNDPATSWILSYAGAPIRSGDEMIGFLNLDNAQAGAFTAADGERLQAFANQAGIAIRNARQFRDIARRAAELEALRSIATALNSTLDLDTLLDSILAHIAEVVPYDAANIMLIEGGRARVVRYQGTQDRPKTGKALLDSAIDVYSVPSFKRVLDSGQPQIIPDVQADPEWLITEVSAWIRSHASVPIRSGNENIGILNLDSAQPSTFTQSHAEWLRVLADTAAIAVGNARQFEDIKQHAAELEALRSIAAVLNSTLDLDALLDSILAHIAEVVPYDSANVMLIDNDVAHIVRYRGVNSGIINPVLGHISDVPNLKRMVDTGQLDLIPDVTADPDWIDIPEGRWIRSHAGAPIRSGERIIGFLNLDSARPNAFTQVHGGWLQALADTAAIAIANARLYEAARQHAAELEALRKASLILTASLDPREVLVAIIRSAIELLEGVKRVQVFLYQNGVLQEGYAVGRDGVATDPVYPPRPDGIHYTTARQGTMITVENIKGHPLFVNGPPDWEGAITVVPLKIGQRVVGVMSAYYPEPRPLSENELRMMQLLGDQAAVAIENARLFRDLQDSEGRFRQLAESINAVFWLVDVKKDEVLYVSPAFQRVTGHAVEELYAQPMMFMDIMHPEDRDDETRSLLRHIRRVIRGKVAGSVELEFRILHTNGQIRWLRTRVFPVTNEAGRVYRVAGTSEDVTDHKLAENQAAALAQERERNIRRFRALFEQSNDAIFLIDAETGTRHLACNQRAADMLGYDGPEDIVALPVTAVARAERDSERLQLLQRLRDGIVLSPYERQFIRKNGDLIDVEINVEMVWDEFGNPMHIQSIVRDITERKHMEAQNLELAVERERTAVLRHFVRDVSHDFRTPLSTIGTSLYLLKHDDHPDSQGHRIEVIEKQVRRLTELVDSLFSSTEWERDEEYDLRACSLNSIIKMVADSMDSAARQKGQAMIVTLWEPMPDLLCDEKALAKAVRNLVENAIQFTPVGGAITLRTAEIHSFAVIEVKDNGPGIRENDLAYIFDYFFRVDRARSMGTGGLGMGLAVARKIVEAHGGKILAESEYGQGSTFRILLPIPSAEQHRARE